jgi:hypothetical protein
MDADQFKQFMLAFLMQHQQFLEKFYHCKRQVLQRNSQVRIQRHLIGRCFRLLIISILKRNPSSTIANDFETFLK